jgi:hypothetical protein
LESSVQLFWNLVFVNALHPQTPKIIRGSWLHYIDTSDAVVGNGANNMVNWPILDLNQQAISRQTNVLTSAFPEPTSDIFQIYFERADMMMKK